MIVSFSTGSLYNLKLSDVFYIANQAGFKYLELMLRGKDESFNKQVWNANYLKKLETRYNLKIKTVHSPIDFESSPEDYLPETINLVKEVNADYLILHLPKNKEKYSHYINWFEQFKDKIDQQEVKILIENMGKNNLYASSNDFNQFSNFCFDTSHALKEYANPIDIVAEMKNIGQFHLSYFNGQEDHLKLTLNKEFFKEIINQVPSATYCLELSPNAFSSSDNIETIAEELKQELEFVKSLESSLH